MHPASRRPDFDPKAFLAAGRVDAYSIFTTGQPRIAEKPDGPFHHGSGFKVVVSERAWDDLPSQIADAIAYLYEHRADLERISESSGVEYAMLDFPCTCRVGSDAVYSQEESFPPELLRLAGELGISINLSLYPPAHENAEHEDGDATG